MRTKKERIKNTYKHIRHKLNIINYHFVYETLGEQCVAFVNQPHRLNKNKFEGRSYNKHTNNKTKRHIHGNHQLSRNYSASDLRKIDFCNYTEEEV